MLAAAHFLGMSVSDWATLSGLMISVGTILFFVKKMLIKWVAEDVKSLKSEVTPNGRDTQKMGDIAARTETKIDNLYQFMERYAIKTDDLEKEVSFIRGLLENIHSKDN